MCRHHRTSVQSQSQITITKVKYIALIISILLYSFSISQAQTDFTINGQVLEDGSDNIPVIGATIRLLSVTDTSISTGTVSDIDGYFSLRGIGSGIYRITISYIGTQPFEQTVSITNGNKQLGAIRLKNQSRLLDQVIVQGQQIRVKQSGDTTEFNAGAFKTNPDANAEDLISKMPGVTSEGGTVKVQGEEVRQVLVDGKPFFGEDPSAALKNLPAEIIDRIQVFDRLSDQSQFTGFDDGQGQKSINIITKSGKNTGHFGKVYAGYGTDDRYTAGGNINIFNGDQRISIIGLSNNINQQNFSTEDLMGVSSGGSGGGGRGRGSAGGGGRSFGRSGGSGGGSNDFLVGQQGGITATNSLGINYSDTWGKKINVSGSYFLNTTQNDNETVLAREFFTTADSGLNYEENSITSNRNANHRVNFRFNYTIDSANSLLITPRLSIQNNSYQTNLTGSSSMAGQVLTGNIINNNRSDNLGYNFNNDILYRRRFTKKGRTLSANIGTQLNGRNGESAVYSLNEYSDADNTLLDQQSDLTTSGYTLSGNITYTEPVGDKSQVMINYNPSFTENSSDKETFNSNPVDYDYTIFDTTLSNKYENTYTTHRGGLSYRFNDTKASFMIGANMQHAQLDGIQFFPYAFQLRQSFTNVLPQTMFNYKFGQGQNLRLMYRTATNAPSVTQLQQVPDITNPLLLKTGNSNLTQDYTHTMIMRYGKTNTTNAHSMFFFTNASYTNDYIGSETIIPTNDSVFSDNITIRRGSQLTRPVNLDGYWNTRSFFTYGLPLNFIKSNLNINTGFNFRRTPSLVNGQSNYSNNYTPSAGIVVSSNISERLDFTFSYNGNYNIVRNTLQQQTDNSYYSHLASLRINWLLQERIVLNSSLDHNMYAGLNQDFDQQFLLWNAYVGYKFLKDRSLEARISVYDLLNQNQSINREITDTYLEDSRTRVLTQYFMFSLTYTLRNFKGVITDNNRREPAPPHHERMH